MRSVLSEGRQCESDSRRRPPWLEDACGCCQPCCCRAEDCVRGLPFENRGLELVPKKLRIHLVMELHFRPFDDGAQQPGTAVRGSLLQIDIPAFYVVAE